MSASELAIRLRDLGVTLWVEGGELHFRAPAGVMTPELRAEIGRCKPQLLALLADAAAATRHVVAIRPAARDGPVPLSFAQERLWFMEQLEPGNPFFNIDMAVRLRWPLDIDALRRSLDEIVRRHEVLRTTFVATPDGPAQLITERLEVPLEVTDLRHLPRQEREARALALANEEARRTFDLARGPLLRARVVRLDRDDHLLLLTIHHIVADGWSMGIFWRELEQTYDAIVHGVPPHLPELSIQYADYAIWQRRHLDGDGLREQLAYWCERLADAPHLELATDHPRRATPRFRGSHVPVNLEPAVGRRLAAVAQAAGATPFMVLMAAFQALLCRYTDQDDIVVGSYIANRNHPQVEPLIGFFVNTLVFRTDVSGDPTFRQLVGRVRDVALGAYANQDVPFPRLVEELQPERDPSRNPIFQVVFQLFNAPTVEQGEGERPLPIERGTAVFDLVLTMWASGDGFAGHFEYDTDLFDHDTVERMAEHFTTLAAAAARDPQRRLSELPLLGAEEWRWVLYDVNDTRRDWLLDRSLVERFGQQAARSPDGLALVHGDQRVTFGQLERRVRRLGQRLRALGVGPGVVVGVCLERSPDAVVALLAIAAAGGAWLALDPSYPSERLQHMVRDSGAVLVLIAGPTGPHAMAGVGVPVHHLPTLEAESTGELAALPTGPGDLAYIIYTSGSTGRPKGVAADHAQILNRLEWMWEAFPFAADEVGCHKTAVSFIDYLWEVFGPLLRGVPAVIVDDETARDPALLVSALARHRVTRLWLVPGMLRALLDSVEDLQARLPRLRFWVTTGEELPLELLERFVRQLPDATLHNCYGTSEAWDATWQDLRAAPPSRHRVPIGRPIANMRAYVLNRHGSPAPIGVPGRLYVGGIGLARGYVGRPELTAERFHADPFVGEPGARFYDTGDRARLLPDGRFQYLGRTDLQLKVRGLRVEPVEVEVTLARHPEVRECAVRVEQRNGEPALTAYLEARAEPPPQPGELRRFLRAWLPEPMIPASFVTVATLPRTPSGKVDRRAIVADKAPQRASGRPPAGPVELVVAGIWQEVLGAVTIGAQDNFFDLGGHSLLGTQVVARLRSALDVELPLRRLFEAPTVEDLAAALTSEHGTTIERRAEVMLQLLQLSDEDVTAMLADDSP